MGSESKANGEDGHDVITMPAEQLIELNDDKIVSPAFQMLGRAFQNFLQGERRMKISMNVRYFTRSLLIKVARMRRRWDYNRQITMKVAEVPDLNYPILMSLPHRHRQGMRCKEHIRCVIAVGYDWLICDVPKTFFNELPQMTMPLTDDWLRMNNIPIAAV